LIGDEIGWTARKTQGEAVYFERDGGGGECFL
jgi:hypothetical protein